MSNPRNDILYIYMSIYLIMYTVFIGYNSTWVYNNIILSIELNHEGQDDGLSYTQQKISSSPTAVNIWMHEIYDDLKVSTFILWHSYNKLTFKFCHSHITQYICVKLYNIRRKIQSYLKVKILMSKIYKTIYFI